MRFLRACVRVGEPRQTAYDEIDKKEVKEARGDLEND